MKKVLGIITFCSFAILSFGQGEGVEPMAGNPQLMKNKKKLVKANPGTFDSTFIYTSDTIDLPIFDEFSKSKFQVYNANYTDPGVTFDKVYRLLDINDVPYDNSAYFSSTERYLFTVDLANNSVTQTLLDTLVKLGDLSSYPVAHNQITAYLPFDLYDTIDFPNPIDTIWMPSPDIYQDSATQFFTTLNDPSAIWLDRNVYHNYTMAFEPWSLGVATFDGLDENGFPYLINSSVTNYADYLYSKPIDMATVGASDSVYFSFMYETQGFCDPPEQSDSLVLEFYAKDLDQWFYVWSADGTPTNGFKKTHIRITDSKYFKKGFQFRFKNYGSLAGSLDHFHLDYVNLRALSGYQDTVIQDFAFVYPVSTLLKTYTSVPWDHYKNNPLGKMSDSVAVVVRNSDVVPENEQDGTTEIIYAGSTEASFVLSESLLNNGDLNYSPMTTYYSFHDFTGGSRFDETKPGLVETFDFVSAATHQNSNFTQNDSTFSKQEFVNYYSYDDGTAELAYGPTGVQSMLAIQYTPYEADSLIGAMIHFVPTVQDVSNNLFLLTVWGDNGGEPGTIIYQDDVFFPRQPMYQYAQNIFTTYYFLDTLKVPVNGTFYIGWQQYDPERLGVGLDCNLINNNKTFYSVDAGVSWSSSSIPGSVMIRPIFSTAYDVVLGFENETQEIQEAVVYPNPTNGIVNIQVNSGKVGNVRVFNMQGVEVLNLNQSQIDLTNFASGVYFIQVNDQRKLHKIVRL